jgi:hypothetical protein
MGFSIKKRAKRFDSTLTFPLGSCYNIEKTDILKRGRGGRVEKI